MNKKLKNYLLGPAFESFLSSFSAILIGLLFGFLILFISHPSQALPGFMTILLGGFTGGAKGLGDVLYFATPLILTGLSVGFAFKTGLFNIGAPGQFVLGSYFAVYVGIKFTSIPPSIHWIVAIAAGMVGGALWGAIPGLLKAYRNVHEVIASIMMNYIGIYLVNMLVKGDSAIFDTLRNQSRTPSKGAIIPKMGLDNLYGNSSVNGGIFVALIAVVVIYIVLNKTTFGYELKACGHNREASRYAGINEKKSIVMSMIISGALAGLGGALLLLAGAGKHLEVIDVLPAEGFNGIPVALLGMSNPIGILLAALFIAYINQGGFYLQLYNFVPEIITIITASIVYFSAFALVFRRLIENKRKKHSGDNRPNVNGEAEIADKSGEEEKI
ncbi:ABC transporter permease [Proteocatella sphenisci]|uniref:ABC transporter permease n=1 Tax=Proteocatella sphenisci TaxID=181070 RepID=UPI0004B73B3E|nr:ABC transporter permease [Proteocatella sphenisci]